MTYKTLKAIPNTEKAAARFVDGVINGTIRSKAQLSKIAALTKHREALEKTQGFRIAMALVS